MVDLLTKTSTVGSFKTVSGDVKSRTGGVARLIGASRSVALTHGVDESVLAVFRVSQGVWLQKFPFPSLRGRRKRD